MNCLKKSCWLKFFAIFAILAGVGGWFAYNKFSSPVKIIDFDYNRDAKALLKVFDKDWYWLVEAKRGQYDPDFMLRYRSRDIRPENFGSLDIKVLLEKGIFAGFTAYYKKNFYEGVLLYLSVDGAFRGKGYGERLLNYAVKAMFDSGCSLVTLVTRLENTRARGLYKKVGFVETFTERDLIHYAKYKS